MMEEPFLWSSINAFSQKVQMELKTRRVHLAACTTTLGDDFMQQIARNLTDHFDGFLKDSKYVLMDHDANFSSAFRSTLRNAGLKPVRLPVRSPNLNAHLERFHLSIKSEYLARMIFFGEKSLEHAVKEYLEHDHAERNHQGIGNRLIDEPDQAPSDGAIRCRERLSGMLKYYFREAA